LDEDLQIEQDTQDTKEYLMAEEVLQNITEGATQSASRAVSRVNLNANLATAASRFNLGGTSASLSPSRVASKVNLGELDALRAAGAGNRRSSVDMRSISNLHGKSEAILIGRDFDDEFGRVGSKEVDDCIVFDPFLGLAIEGTPSVNELGQYEFVPPDTQSLWRYSK
jgi:hypothetical protein